jgi:hypothetical protein
MYSSFSVGSKQRPFGRTNSSVREVSSSVFALSISTLQYGHGLTFSSRTYVQRKYAGGGCVFC